jgi:peroxiredoxin/uncharacterized membrane protein YphA (DoxX/SURF4 family)
MAQVYERLSDVLLMTISLLIMRLLIAVVFAIAGMAKLLNAGEARKSMADFGIPDPLVSPLARLLPLTELLLAATLIPVTTAWWAAIGVFIMLLLFIGAIVINLARGRRPDCHCFGQLHASPVGWKTIVRNAALALLAALVIWRGPDSVASASIAWDGLSGSQSAVSGLAIAVVLLAVLQMWSLVHVLRQNGRLLLRLETLEGRAGAPAEPVPAGLPVNTLAPAFSLEDMDGASVTLEDVRKQGKPVLLFFSEAGCNACDTALPELAQWQGEFAERISIVAISTGSAESNRAKIKKFNVRNLLLQKKRETAEAYRIEGTPGAVLITGGLVASHVASGIDAIRALVARATLPPSVKKGDAAPTLNLPDLKGTAINLGNLRGRRTLLLFWNPSCGFCQKMLEDVKAWERNRPDYAAELLVISAGAPEASRKEGFRSRVLLDPSFAASQVFNSGGTPSAVLLDEHGIVASDVAVGAPEVLELVGAASNARP